MKKIKVKSGEMYWRELCANFAKFENEKIIIWQVGDAERDLCWLVLPKKGKDWKKLGRFILFRQDVNFFEKFGEAGNYDKSLGIFEVSFLPDYFQKLVLKDEIPAQGIGYNLSEKLGELCVSI